MTKLYSCLLFTVFIVASKAESASTDLLTTAQCWGFGLLAGLSVSLLGFVAAFILVGIKKCLSDSTFKFIIGICYSLGCGALIGDAMIHILPDAYTSPDNNPHIVSLIFICSLIFFLILERVFQNLGIAHSHWGEGTHEHQHQHAHEHSNQQSEGTKNKIKNQHQGKEGEHQGKEGQQHCDHGGHEHFHKIDDGEKKVEKKDTKQENSIEDKVDSKILNTKRKESTNEILQQLESNQQIQNPVDSPVKTSEAKSEDQEKEKTCLQNLKGKGSAGYLNLLSSFIHNFMDGFAIGVAFASGDKTIYIPVLVAIFAHEIPRELGDVAILMKNRFTGIQTILCNGFINLMSLLGVVVGLALASINEGSKTYVMVTVAGNFIYIAADIWRNLFRNKDNPCLLNSLEFLGVALGVGSMYLVLLAEEN